MDIQAISAGLVGAVAVTGGLWALGKYGPGLVVRRIRDGLDNVKASAWVRDPARPKRAKALLAVLELLEDEIPEPGQGQEVYDSLGIEISAYTRVGLLQIGSAAQWAKVLRQFGDAVDTELDDEIKQLAGQDNQGPALPPAVSVSSGTSNSASSESSPVNLNPVPGDDKKAG